MEENEKKVKETEVKAEGESLKKSAKKKIEKLNNEIEKLHADVDHWKNEYYRAYADTQNLRKSLEKDHQNAIKYRAEGFIDSLLPVLDSFHMALENKPANPEIANYLVGFQYIYKNLVTALEGEGVKEIAPKVGDKFDPNTMDAIDVEISDGEEDRIVRVMAKGYMIHDRLVRPVRVVVSKKQEEKENKDTVE